jgi:hypothetical protein
MHCALPGSAWIFRANSVGTQNIPAQYNSFQLVNIRAAYDWQEIEPGGAHAFQSQVKRLIGVEMRKRLRIHQFAQLFFSSVLPRSLQQSSFV